MSGGGDGALLYELLKEQPKEVIMVEIDETVMSACSKYMRSACGNVLDKLEGPNYKVISNLKVICGLLSIKSFSDYC